MRIGLRGLLVWSLGLLPVAGHADPGDWVEGWRFGAELGTDFPIQVGASFHVEMPSRFRIHTSLGAMPGPYLDAINGLAISVGWYDELTADLIKAALKNSLIWRLRLGWRPWEQQGFYFGAGYTLGALGGGLSGAEVMATVTGIDLDDEAGGQRSFDVKSTVHMVDAEVGWEWVVWKGLLIRTALGGAFTVGSKTVIEPTWTPVPRAKASVDELSRAGEAYLDETYRAYVHSATVTVAVGWVF